LVGNSPAASTAIEDADLNLDSVDLVVSLAVIYRTTRLARG
jgi:3-oxoacyl-[acyl-carrier-protein] synthase III